MATKKERSEEERINERRPVRHSDMRIAWVIPDVQLGKIFMDKDIC